MLCSNDVNDVASNGKFIVEVRNRFQALDDQQETGAEEPLKKNGAISRKLTMQQVRIFPE